MSRFLAIALLLGVTSAHAELPVDLAANLQERVNASLEAKVEQVIEEKAAQMAVELSEHAALK